MTTCQACKRPTHTYICDDCTNTLADMLNQLPWLLDELDNRIQQLDRMPYATIGRNRRPNEHNIIDFDAAETSRNTRKLILKWVETITQRHTGRTPPALSTATTKTLAHWLYVNIHAIQRLNCAGQLHHDISRLVGADQKGGHLVAAINRHEKHFAGPCPTIHHYNNHGEPIECATILYADTDERTTQCPECKQTINVENNRRKAAAERDLLPETKLLEVLQNLGEEINPAQLAQWIKARRLRPRGWLHQGEIVQHRIRNSDQPVYSVTRARKIRTRDQHARQQTHPSSHQC